MVDGPEDAVGCRRQGNGAVRFVVGLFKGSVRGSTRTLNTWVQEGAYRTYVRTLINLSSILRIDTCSVHR